MKNRASDLQETIISEIREYMEHNGCTKIYVPEEVTLWATDRGPMVSSIELVNSKISYIDQAGQIGELSKLNLIQLEDFLIWLINGKIDDAFELAKKVFDSHHVSHVTDENILRVVAAICKLNEESFESLCELIMKEYPEKNL